MVAQLIQSQNQRDSTRTTTECGRLVISGQGTDYNQCTGDTVVGGSIGSSVCSIQAVDGRAPTRSVHVSVPSATYQHLLSTTQSETAWRRLHMGNHNWFRFRGTVEVEHRCSHEPRTDSRGDADQLSDTTDHHRFHARHRATTGHHLATERHTGT